MITGFWFGVFWWSLCVWFARDPREPIVLSRVILDAAALIGCSTAIGTLLERIGS